MVSFLQAIILGIVQGITEWLPISSSGHLVLFQKWFGLQVPVVFDVFLHIGSLIVILLVFWKDIKRLIVGVVKGERYFLRYFAWLVIATIPIALVGYFLNDLIKSAFDSVNVVGFALLFTALLLFISKYPKIKRKKLSWKSIVVIGLMQALAILPGVSRSGTTISTGLVQGGGQEEVARFSFLLFIPAILGALVLELGSVSEVGNIFPVIVGVGVTILVGFFSLKLLLKIIQKGKFSYFGWYCLALGILVLVF